MTKQAFLAAYRAELTGPNGYPWTADADLLAKFMASVERTITTQATTWNLGDSDAAKRAWRAIGGTGKPTYKGLRALA